MRSRGREPLVYYFRNLHGTRRKPASKGDSIISVDELSKILERMTAMQETRFQFEDIATIAKHHFGNCLMDYSHKSQTREHIPLQKDRTYRIRGADLLSDVLLVLREQLWMKLNITGFLKYRAISRAHGCHLRNIRRLHGRCRSPLLSRSTD